MNMKLSFNITREETVSVLQTILMFFDGLNLNQTSKVLQDECSEKGYNIVRTESQLKLDTQTSPIPKINCSDSRVDNWQGEKYFTLENPIVAKSKEDVVFYCIDPLTSRQSPDTRDRMQNHQFKKSNKYASKLTKRFRSLSSDYLEREMAKQNGTSFKSRSYPLLNLKFQEPTLNSQNWEKNYMNPEIKSYRKLKKSFRKLEAEHQKLMSITTELTAALQTYILGQTENLNATLNKCKIIYPELFHLSLPRSTCSEEVKLLTLNNTEESFPLETNQNDNLEVSKVVEKAHKAVESIDFTTATPDTFKAEKTEEEVLTEAKGALFESCKCHSYKLAGPLQEVTEHCDTIDYLYTDNYFELDYKKIKEDLLTGDDELRVTLLQGLRTRITQSSNEFRAQVIQSYVYNDLLELKHSTDSTGKLLTEVYFTTDTESFHLLQEELSRLVNALASLTIGRDYMCQSEALLSSLVVLILKIDNSNINESTRDMLIATIQKLSLRHGQRVYMINSGLVEHILTFLLNNHSSISHYCMEYTTALFMNLCVHKSARTRLHPYATDVVSLMVNLLDTKYNFCIAYVNGTMYSLLSDPIINEQAHRVNLSKLLEYHISYSENQIKKELQHILELHLKGGGNQMCDCGSNTECNVEFDIMEPELDNVIPKETVIGVILSYKLSESSEQIRLKDLPKPVTPLLKSVKEEDDNFGNNSKLIDSSYCEETKQYYHTPSRNEIFEQQKTKKLHRVPPSFTKVIPVTQKPQANPITKHCRYYPRYFSRQSHFIPNRSGSSQNKGSNSDLGYFGMCYRDEYTTRNHLLRENKYTCDCYNVIREAMNLPPQEDKDDNKDETDNNSKPKFYYCHRCHRLTDCSQSCIDTGDKMANGNSIDFPLKELSKTVHLGDRHICPCQDDCHCYDVVFQSRPKLLRTPP